VVEKIKAKYYDKDWSIISEIIDRGHWPPHRMRLYKFYQQRGWGPTKGDYHEQPLRFR
jgi:hypothetical protein